MSLSLALQLISTAIMIIGVAFGIQNIRQYQAARRRESAILMLNSFQTSDFVRGFLAILNLPEGASKEDIDRLSPDEFLAVYLVMGTWERLGLLVFRRELELELVDDAYSGPIIQSWHKLGAYIQEFREMIQRETAFEWFQWLAEQMLKRETNAGPVPAYVAHRNWEAKR